MGSRAQILIEDEKVYLYTHWGANDLEEDLKHILNTDKARGRWDDSEYLTRIIFSEMIKDDIDGATGYGIGGSEHGDIQLLITLNIENQHVIIEDKYSDNDIMEYFSFQDFIDSKKHINDILDQIFDE